MAYFVMERADIPKKIFEGHRLSHIYTTCKVIVALIIFMYEMFENEKRIE